MSDTKKTRKPAAAAAETPAPEGTQAEAAAPDVTKEPIFGSAEALAEDGLAMAGGVRLRGKIRDSEGDKEFELDIILLLPEDLMDLAGMLMPILSAAAKK